MMNRHDAINLRKVTGYTPYEWYRKLTALYNEAKRRNGGASLSIYGKVSDMYDRLDALNPTPDLDTLARDLNDLAGELRHT